MLTPPNYRYIETKIIAEQGKNRGFMDSAKQEVMEYKHKLDYIMSKFIDQFGAKLDVDAKRNEIYIKFTKVKSEEYAAATRILRLIDHYLK